MPLCGHHVQLLIGRCEELPNIKSSAKRDQLQKAANAKNKAAKSALKTEIKKGLIHKNNAAHKKSAMAKKINALAE